MTIRDKLKNVEYFDRWLDYDAEQARKVQNKLDTYTIALPYGRVTASYDQFRRALDRLIMRYSRGDALIDLRGDAAALLAARQQIVRHCDALPAHEQHLRRIYERLSLDSYVSWFRWLSFAVCLGLPRDHVMQVLALIDSAGQDALLDRIAAKLGDVRPIAQNVRFPDQYARLNGALDALGDEQARLIGEFLDGWYASHYQAGWFDTHERDDAGYVGYWCFEAALVVKLFEIDDSTFRDNPFYPADLVRAF
ncbi:PoNe immunity protein domain-containing protein [Trinickia fusca]|uniref:DUF1911 domain-containing protein n=1 Tax=Trinickia fusca TaxID=2419777 RepID=A0A494XWY5_9BURK|nr:PoNe immunity protein domain-containing protein [Trinickia fusca]RKP52624.1 DUF1911 domain-containing protein [Trinickia fusca]